MRTRHRYGTFRARQFAGLPRGNFYKARRVGRRAFRRILWRDTIAQQHWRSCSTAQSTIVTSTNANNAIWTNARQIASSFWTTGGGLILPEGANPTFTGDLTVRGGLFRMYFHLGSGGNNFPVEITVYKVWIRDATSLTVNAFPPFQTGASAETIACADPSTFPGSLGPSGGTGQFQQQYRIIHSRTIILPNIINEAAGVYTDFMRIKKVDQNIHNDNNHQIFYWIRIVNRDAAGVNVTISVDRSMSFTGDVDENAA